MFASSNVWPALYAHDSPDDAATSHPEDPVSLPNHWQNFVRVICHWDPNGGSGDERFRDVLPQPPLTVPAEICHLPPQSIGCVISHEDHPGIPVCPVFCTPPNILGLMCQYFSDTMPSHDPEEYVTTMDLSFIPTVPQDPPIPSSNALYHPYPNHSSFQLSDWYWNQGLQMSQADYMKLLEIMGTSDLNPADVSSTNWKNINSMLGANEYDEGDKDEWHNEDTGWKRMLISIYVPFSHTTQVPGSQVYEAAHLYHRSLVSVLQEKLSNS
ncbi:uncharacterized protein BJ212DRAFT_1476740 [Suillus subaureus]|uniref:Uncharacterized protein n=1 Tax=Suillus subaureus TaxID=48587 RepID=A0A9P7JI40_9AGAM|nr:uncharacterized protein BJ212DRAFT_1476740 [Suillus subaureus]KAG1823888.1 hypothetical protein BJ212DRAFT_1476740 [Suillus subaureus]